MYVREKRRSEEGGHGMVEVKLLCFRWRFPFFEHVQNGISRICLKSGHLCSPRVGKFLVQWVP